MCVLVAIRFDDPPRLLLGANRDERLDRPWRPPHLLLDEPPVFGGQDLVGGGSWLAVNLAAGVVVGVTNARLGAPPGERSRGELVVSVAREGGVAEALALVAELDLKRYGPFNLLIADVHTLWSATNLPIPSLRREEGAVVVIGNTPVGTAEVRTHRAHRAALSLARLGGERAGSVLGKFLADHTGEDPLCRHGQGYGTVCSTILELAPGGVRSYRFAAGPPCTTPFTELLLPSRYS